MIGRLRSYLRRAATSVAAAVDARDLVLATGLVLAGYGLFEVYPPAAFIGPGCVLIYVAIFGVKVGRD
ncbi:hypothetical protein [Mesorhizobium sp. CAU 1741]|uniref:hypothetical protein n=1 Tax=Mesorhizobium sp. CAU 1741 TaxID=3140366 RepID=UPI00325ADA49